MVIFTTAHDRFAVTAFELGAVDYLLKPFGAERFRAAMGRARNVVHAVLTKPDGEAPLNRVFVRDGNAVVPLTLADVERIEAQDDYVLLHTRIKRHLVSLRIRDLELRLPNPPFLRVHRSHIVNLDHVERMVGLDDSRLEVRMKNGAAVPVSRARSQELRRLAR